MNSGSGSGRATDPRVAVLDLGTNSFNLLIGEIRNENGPDIELLHTDRASVKLGKEGIGSDKIAPAAEERGLKAIQDHLKKIQEWDCGRTLAVATSGIRTASNGPAFLERIEKSTGQRVELIDGDREADLIAEGVRAAVPLGDEPVLILDIGGGSSEFLIADAHRTYWKKSYRIGAARLLNDIAPSDPIRENERKKAEQLLEERINDLLEVSKAYSVKSLVGCSGSFESIADMAFHRFPEAAEARGNGWARVELPHFHTLHQELLKSSLEERYRTPGLARMRAEMIVLGTIFIDTVLRRTGIERILTSYYSLREGILMEEARKMIEASPGRTRTDR